MKNLVVPDSVESFGAEVFSGCDGLVSITLPFVGANYRNTGKTHFGYIFGAYDVYNQDTYISPVLQTVTITNTNYISTNAFKNCSTLVTVRLPHNLLAIRQSAFENCSAMASIAIPDAVTTIESNAFNGCTSLEFVHISNLMSWCNISFADQTSNPLFIAKKLYLNGELLTEVSIPDGITEVRDYTFNGYTMMTTLTLSEGVVKIGKYAFARTLITQVRIPDNVTNLGEGAFSDCGNLESVSFGVGLKTIGERAFDGCYSLSDVTLPGGLSSIGAWAFYGCFMIRTITIPNTVKAIGTTAFGGCSIENATVPAFVCNSINNEYLKTVVVNSGDTIAARSFKGCKNLVSVTLSEGIKVIEDSAFEGCTALKTIVIPCGVASIGERAFIGCTSLVDVYIPDSVATIGNAAFRGCAGLTNIYFAGTISQWNSIEKVSGWNTNTGEYSLHYETNSSF